MNRISLNLAERKRFRNRWSGWFLQIAASIFIAIGAIKSLYIPYGVSPSDPLSTLIPRAFLPLARWIYENVSFVWYLAPTLNLHRIFDFSNFRLLCFFGLVLLGTAFRESASNLSKSIARAREHVQEEHWKEEITGPRQVNPALGDASSQIEIRISQQDNWWTRPTGIIAIGILIAVVAQWINITFGLAH